MNNHTNTRIQILPSADIDRQKWDACVINDPKALIYSSSWYLNKMAEHWYGLVVNDYEAVLALPFKKLAGVIFICTPPFFQRMDIAGTYNKNTEQEVAKRILRFSRLIDMHNSNPDFWEAGYKRQKTNYILRLNRPYKEIADTYSKECKKNIGKAVNRGCAIKHGISIQEVISFYQKAYGAKASYKKKHFDRLTELMESCEAQQYIHLTGVVNETTSSLIFAAALLDDGKRIYYLLGAPSEEGRQARATAFFIDQVISQFAGKREIFDFEGSDIPEVASFYRSFSPETEHYYRFYINNFPQPVKGLIDKMLQ